MTDGPSNLERPATRQELYERIRQSSKDEVVREEMVRLGFWPASGAHQDDLASEMARRSEVLRELNVLRTEQARLRDEKAVLQAIRKRRLAESRRKREETKTRKLQERQERAETWALEKSRALTYLGEGVSGTLNQAEGNPARLAEAGLPELQDGAAIASAMAISVGELRFLAFARVTSQVSHYVRFSIPKKSGGQRTISAPMARLKAAQHWVLHQILAKVKVHEAAHGFIEKRSIVTNAAPHVGRQVVINLDLKDFFPTVTYPRVWGQFRALGYSPAASTILALLCTEPEVEQVELDGRTWYVAVGERRLPQGAPTSPALTNILCRRLDRKLTTLAGRMGFTYTRYADDLTFSAGSSSSQEVGKLLRRVKHLVRSEGFEVHPHKTRVFRRGGRQEVTGLVVNDRPAVDRSTLRRFRAVLYQIERDGPEGKTWGQCPDVVASVMGFADFIFMVDPVKGEPLRLRARALVKKYGAVAPALPAARPEEAVVMGETSEAEATEEATEETKPTEAKATEAKAEEAADGGGSPWWKLW